MGAFVLALLGSIVAVIGVHLANLIVIAFLTGFLEGDEKRRDAEKEPLSELTSSNMGWKRQYKRHSPDSC